MVEMDSGEKRLNELGYKQELRREMTLFKTLAISFSTMTLFTGITPLYGTSLLYAGPASLVWGWVVVSFFTWFVGIAMAEICSSFPTTGSLYFWAAHLAGPVWGPFASWCCAWLEAIGLIAGIGTQAYAGSQVLQSIILLCTGTNKGGGYFAPRGVFLAMYICLTIIWAVLNTFALEVIAIIDIISIWWQVIGGSVIVIMLPLVSLTTKPASYVFTHFETAPDSTGITSKAYAVILSILVSQYSLYGYDAAAHLTEETKGADRNGPIAILSSIGIISVFGWAYILALTFSIQDFNYLYDTGNETAGAFVPAQILYDAFHGRYNNSAGAIVLLFVIWGSFFFGGLSITTSAGPFYLGRATRPICLVAFLWICFYASMAATASEHPRRLLHGFVSPELCKELEFIHRSCGTVGYRPSVFSTTLPHLAATNCAHLILPFLPLRDRLKDTVEDIFGCEFELVVEFTGLISWCKGACIGWHSDDNKPYLRQRDFAAVCYLNSHEKDFNGGLFHFKDGEPSSIAPTAGDVVVYTADERNVHSVDEVIDGERLTLTLWFTHDSAHDEDTKLINLLSQRLLVEHIEPKPFLPLPASSCMYWLAQEKSGFDVRCARVSILGYDFCPSEGKCSTDDSPCDPLELLDGRLYLGRGDEVLDKEFVNSLHALQVVQFCGWKAAELATEREVHRAGSTRPTVLKRSNNLELLVPCDYKLGEAILGGISRHDPKPSFSWDDLVLGIARWEEYMSELHRKLLILIPYWLSNHTLSFVDATELL